jgi:Protein of unknown function (DUF3300)
MLSATLFAIFLGAGTPDMVIPAGTILPVVLNETLNTAKLQDDDPVLFSLAEDVRPAGHRSPILIPRGSSVVGRVVKSERAGHFIGHSEMDIRIQEIVTPSGEEYDGLTTKIVDIGKRKGEKGAVKRDGVIQGPSHAGRDAFLLLFPPTTIFQLMATPRRGPDVVLPVETRLYVKLMTPIYVETRAAAGAAPSVGAPSPVPYPQPTSQVMPALSPNTLEILVSPVALYPDAILRDLLTACAHPVQIVEANRWVHGPRDAAGSLPRNGYNERWDSSVQAITGYPDLLQRLGADMDWVTKLGSAFVAQPSDVMAAVQRMRIQAHSLRSPEPGPALAFRR